MHLTFRIVPAKGKLAIGNPIQKWNGIKFWSLILRLTDYDIP